MNKQTKIILLVATSVIVVSSVAFYLIIKKRNKEMEEFYLKQLQDFKAPSIIPDDETTL